MSAELGSTEDPRALVPGDPESVAADARLLSDRATDLVRTGEALRRIGAGGWTGRAADAWREHHDEDATRWFRGADSLDSAAAALARHADALGRAQAEAARAVALWRDGDAATADVERQVAAGAVAPPVDPGERPRRDAVDILATARTSVLSSGDQVAAVLRGEAVLAPRDSQKQIDADFYGGIRDSISGAAEGAWTAVTDPAAAVAGVVQAAAHPVDTVESAIAWDDWTNGREPRALGRNTGDMILGVATLGAGKIASVLGRETRIAGDGHGSPDRRGDGPDPPASGGTAPGASRVDEVKAAVLDPAGAPHGAESSKRVYMVSESELRSVLQDLRGRLGPPDLEHRLPKGEVETWMIDPESDSNVTYRTFSKSGGATIDVNLGDDFPIKRFHVQEDGS